MAHFAKIESGIVTEVIVADQDFVLTIICMSLALALFFPNNGLLVSLTMAINMISTTAFVISDPALITNYLPAAIFFLPVLIGGMTLSTAGGLKVLRFYLLVKRVTYEVVNLPYPNSVESMHYGGKFVSKETMASVWGLFLMYFVGFVDHEKMKFYVVDQLF